MVENKKVIIENHHGEKLVGILHETGSNELVIICHGFRSTKVYDLVADSWIILDIGILQFSYFSCVCEFSTNCRIVFPWLVLLLLSKKRELVPSALTLPVMGKWSEILGCLLTSLRSSFMYIYLDWPLLFRESEGSFQYGNYRREAEDLRAVVEHFQAKQRCVVAIIGHSKGI